MMTTLVTTVSGLSETLRQYDAAGIMRSVTKRN